MKVILLQNIQSLGNKYQVKEVADGYARNFLVPKELAVIYNQDNEKFYQTLKLKESKTDHKKVKNDLINNSEQFILNFQEKANELGKLYAQINKKRLLTKLNKEYRLDLKPDDLLINRSLKEIGTYLVGIKPNNLNKIKVIIEKV